MSIDQGFRVGREADLESAVPDAALVARLEGVEPAGLTGDELAAYVRACARAQNRATAVLLDALHHLGRAQADRLDRRSGLDEFSGDEVATVLGWSRTMAGRKLDLADDLQRRLTEVGDALYAGRLDEAKARTFCDWTRDLADDHAHHVCEVVLPEAPELPVGALIERIEEVAKALDPEWAERRRRRAEARARVVLSPNPSGTANLSFADAPAPEAIASHARVEALAAAVRHLGVLTPIGPLRAQVGMRLLDGSTAGMDDRAIALLLAAEYHAAGSPDEPEADEGPDEDPGGPDDGPDDDGPDDGTDDDGPVDSGVRADDDPGETTPQCRPDVLDLPEPLDHRPGALRVGTVEVRLRLTTALGLDRHPGTVPGYGTVLAGDALTMIMRRLDGEWRIVLTDPQGHLQHVLLARRRPAGPRHRSRRPGRGCERAIVELRVPTTLLAALTPEDHGDWAPLLAELQQRLVELRLAPGHVRPPDADAGPDDRARRRARAELDRWIRVRDRHCVAPSCRRPANRADLDHTLAHALGGPTSHWNLGAWCRHHHRAKHHAGWRVRQPSPGRFTIRTRAGVTTTTAPRRVLEPLPDPRPAARPRPLPVEGRPDDAAEGIDPDWWRKLAPTAPARPAPAPRRRDDLDDAPPF
ncbi:DUF222 domain-containing protein [Actinomycetospora sp. CA-101289]|uniref:DUF222 domain-containing protein n=1 Tax=Actinomycetospora sp. CA-101289 TaxID=3239893 RepID=UPI003D95E6B2